MKAILAILLISSSLGLQASPVSSLFETVTQIKNLSRSGDFKSIDDLIYKSGEFGVSVPHVLKVFPNGSKQYITFFNSHSDGLQMRVYHKHPLSYARLRPGSFTQIETRISSALRAEGLDYQMVQLKAESHIPGKTSVGQVRIFNLGELSESKTKRIIRIVSDSASVSSTF